MPAIVTLECMQSAMIPLDNINREKVHDDFTVGIKNEARHSEVQNHDKKKKRVEEGGRKVMSRCNSQL